MPDSANLIGRRDLLAGLAAGVAGAVVIPGVEAGTSAPETAELQAGRGAQAPAAPTMPRLLDEHRRAMLEGIAEQILPGASAAGVADLTDRVLAVEPAATQRRFLNALGAFEREARDRHGKGWTEVTSAQQLDLLRAAATLPPSRPAAPGWTRGEPIERPAGPPNPPANLRDHFDHLKDWVQRVYVTTAQGMKDFGFTGATAFETFPGCPHSGDDHAQAPAPGSQSR